ncbi:unnamed protein product [Soboliphyme baturini]|uniref:BPTI/Kunitz inhibitor domain-containing protein n=1 Tax=Soboliphyme baturini TaxID=241478 RepID=A0A183IH27_9BILA|nr:unnamed protein product [Soboliphyme baturini]
MVVWFVLLIGGCRSDLTMFNCSSPQVYEGCDLFPDKGCVCDTIASCEPVRFRYVSESHCLNDWQKQQGKMFYESRFACLPFACRDVCMSDEVDGVDRAGTCTQCARHSPQLPLNAEINSSSSLRNSFRCAVKVQLSSDVPFPNFREKPAFASPFLTEHHLFNPRRHPSFLPVCVRSTTDVHWVVYQHVLTTQRQSCLVSGGRKGHNAKKCGGTVTYMCDEVRQMECEEIYDQR